ncbi:MAG: pitrilysin family protein [Myxococcota bacterium]|nr:pitrilysin family protein [Myxococcota bacterium]
MKRWTIVLGTSAALLAASGCSHLSLDLPGSLAAGSTFGAPFETEVPAWELPPPPPKEAPITQPGALARFELENGLLGIVLRDKRLPQVVLGLSVRRGSGSEPVAQAGLAALTAEVMERGAGDRDALELAQLVDGIGANFAVNSNWDSMVVRIGGLSRDMDAFFEVLGDVVLRPRFDAAEVTKAREEKLAALEQAKDDPRTLVGWYATRAVYGDHRYGTPSGGNAETVRALDVAALRAFHARNFVASNAVVFAAGDVDAADFERRVRATFGGWETGEIPAAVEAPPAQAPAARKIVIVDKPDLRQARIIVIHEGLSRTDDRRVAAGLANDVLGGGGFSSRLMKSIRSDAGLTYGVYSGFGLRRQPGPFSTNTFTQVPQVRQALDLVLDELDRMRSEPPDEEEIAKAKSLRVGRFGLGLETSGAVVNSLVDLEVHGLPEDALDTFRSKVRAVGPAQVAELSRALIHPDRAAIVLLGPADELVPLVEDLGPVEVVQP